MEQAAMPTTRIVEPPVTSTQSIGERIRAAQALHKRSRAQGLAALNDLFREGKPPATALDGRAAGELVALNIAPGLTQATEWLFARWLPWKGKMFNAASAQGNNVFTRDSYGLAHVLWPLYRGYVDDGAQTYRAFTFRTYVAAGLQDPDRQVLKIDYDLPINPGLTIRHVLDELVQVDDNYYLGKALVRWWWGTWQTVAYFGLRM